MTNTTDTKTIMVQNSFGKDKEINLADFIKRWKDHAQELNGLASSEAQSDLVATIVDLVEGMAKREFNRLYWLQNAKKGN